MFKRVVPILLIILWLIVIFNFSSHEDKGWQFKSRYIISHTHENYYDTGKVVDGHALNTFISKEINIVLYFVLCLLVLNALYVGGFRGRDLFIRAFIICFFYAVMDKINRGFIVNKGGKLSDIFIDSIGIALGIALAFIIERAYNIMKKGY